MPNNDNELVVLVDENDNELGVMEKSKVHTAKTPLHRGLSVFLFDDKSRVLVQRRALHKKTWPGVWSNSCCGHPQPGEAYIDAARREVKEELGLEVEGLHKVSDYRYRFERNRVVENEICPVFAGVGVGQVRPEPSEVMDYKWMKWEEFRRVLKEDDKGAWSEWCKEEAELVQQQGVKVDEISPR
jgi:isopentenyl-diphosphate delta-isomerase